MVIDKIGGIHNIPEPKKSKQTSAAGEAGRKDAIEISSEGKLAAEISKSMQTVHETPDVRADKVKDIRERIQNGSYDFDDSTVLSAVAGKVAGILLKE